MHSRSKAPAEVQAALERLPDSAWTAVASTEDCIVYQTLVDIGGQQVVAQKTEYRADELLQAANTQEFNESEGKRWGNGKIAARIPLHKWLQEFAPRLQDGDRDFEKWWLNHEDNRPFRTFKGKV